MSLTSIVRESRSLTAIHAPAYCTMRSQASVAMGPRPSGTPSSDARGRLLAICTTTARLGLSVPRRALISFGVLAGPLIVPLA